ncbi:MAG TPA: hypothetical protein VFK35_01425 [Candidatus Limnocylindrales bacterium]|nr:hypothetical protein [Candidatus Limnocylindrales bacterium]
MAHTSRLRGVGRIVLLVAAVAGLTAPTFAASPSPPAPGGSAAPGEEPHDTGLETWLDAPLPAGAQPGAILDIGAVIWDTRGGELAQAVGGYMKLYPLSGDADPTEGAIRSDWPGHVRGSVVVPEGGPGRIEIGFRGQECPDDGGACRLVDMPFTDGGIGPPPGAPRALLVIAAFRPPVESLVVGRPVALELDLTPRAEWDVATLGLPDRLLARVRPVRGSVLASVELRRAGGVDAPYGGSIVIPEAGDLVLEAAVPGNGGEDQVIPGSILRLTVAASDDGPGPATAGGQGDAPLSIPLLVAALAAAIAAGLVIRRVFADL